MLMRYFKKLAGGLAIFLGIILTFVWFVDSYEISQIPTIVALNWYNPPYTTYMALYKLKHPSIPIKRDFVSFDKISGSLKNAVISHEDDLFYNHPGYDWNAIKRAWKFNLRKKKIARGASTITQQLARNLFLYPLKSPVRKWRELVLAVEIEHILNKKRILELYLNSVEWGPGVFGAEAAAKYYFNCTAAQLGPSQSAFLASILPKPSKYAKHAYKGKKK